MPARLKPELTEIILGLYEPSDRNTLKASRMLREQGHSTSRSTVHRIWNAAGYQLRTQGGIRRTQDKKTKATSCSDGVKAIMGLYPVYSRDPIKAQEQLKTRGYQATITDITKCWHIVNSFDRYNGNSTLAARSLPYHCASIARYWRLAGLRTREERLEERL